MWMDGQHTSRTTKLSPSLLHRTTELYAGSSSILLMVRQRHADGTKGTYAGRTCIVFGPGPMLAAPRIQLMCRKMLELTKSLELFPAACAAAKSPSGGGMMMVGSIADCVGRRRWSQSSESIVYVGRVQSTSHGQHSSTEKRLFETRHDSRVDIPGSLLFCAKTLVWSRDGEKMLFPL